LAETAGFCFGVRRAVDLAERTAADGVPCVTLGPIIHNRHVVERLRQMGVGSIDTPEEAESGSRVIIRSHGVGRAVLEALAARGVEVIDATCPDVKKIHRIIEAADAMGRQVVLVGGRAHPEVIAACGWCTDPVVVECAEEIEAWISDEKNREKPLTVVFQTTYARRKMEDVQEILKKWCTSAEIFDTICNATSKRQAEAAHLAEGSDAMIVIGDTGSANSRNLAAICAEYCEQVAFVEGAADLHPARFDAADTIGIVAGASTPAWIIREVYQTMSDEILKNAEETAEPTVETTEAEATTPVEEAEVEVVVEEAAPAAEPEAAAEEVVEVAEVVEIAEEPAPTPVSEPAPVEKLPVQEDDSFEAMLDKTFKTLRTGEKVVGIVTSISPTEVSVDLGAKQAGYIPIHELADDPDVKVEDIIQVGGEVEAYIMRVNDVEGMIMLSKKRLDTVKYWDEIDAARGGRTTVEGVVTEENKGGVVVRVKGVRVFVPASQTGIPKDHPMTELIGQKVKLRITEVNQSRRRVVGSIKAVGSEMRKERAEKTWAEIENGKRYAGTVKSLTSYGVFVDIGGVDGMVHVSELSWNRIKSPADVVKVGDPLDVYVISFDKEKRKISLGHKDPKQNPWKNFTDKYEKGSVAKVKVVKLMPFGAFAEIVPGVDGLIHISQIADRRIGKPHEFLEEGQEIDVMVTDIDYDKKNVSLSIRALFEDTKPAPAEEDVYEEDNYGGEDAVVYDTDINKPEPEAEEDEPEVEVEVIVEEPVAEEPVVEIEVVSEPETAEEETAE